MSNTAGIRHLPPSAPIPPAAARAVELGWHNVMLGFPWREAFRNRASQRNYELGRLAAFEWLRLGNPPRLRLAEAIRVFALQSIDWSIAVDTCPAFPNRARRPRHLIDADLANELTAAGLVSLAPNPIIY